MLERTIDLRAIQARIEDCASYNFGLRNADQLAHVDAPDLLNALRKVEAERDGLLATVEAALDSSEVEGYEHDDWVWLNEANQILDSIRAIVNDGPAQSLANHDAALLAEVARLTRIIDGYDRTPAEQRAADAEAMVERVRASADEWWSLYDSEVTEHAESLREAAEKAWVEARSHSDAFYDPALDEAINPYRKIEPERTFEELMQDDRIRYTARRDAKGCIRLSGGQGALVAGPEDTRVEVQAWFDRAGGAKWAAQYKAALNLIDKELAAEYRKTEPEGS